METLTHHAGAPIADSIQNPQSKIRNPKAARSRYQWGWAAGTARDVRWRKSFF